MTFHPCLLAVQGTLQVVGKDVRGVLLPGLATAPAPSAPATMTALQHAIRMTGAEVVPQWDEYAVFNEKLLQYNIMEANKIAVVPYVVSVASVQGWRKQLQDSKP